MSLAYAHPAGNVDAYSGDSLDQTVGWTVPIGFDAGWRPNRRWFFGARFVYAPGFVGDALSHVCARCNPEDVRIGVEVERRFWPSERWDPWVGAGFGYEWLHIRTPNGNLGLEGWEIVHVQAGLDYAYTPRFRAGPFIAASVGRYQSAFTENSGPNPALGPASLHAWVAVGLKMAFDVGSRGDADQWSK